MIFTSWATFASTSICDNPLQNICTETKTQRAERDIEIQKLKQEINSEASKNAASRIDEMKKHISILHPLKRIIQSFKIRNQETMKSTKLRIGDLDKGIMSAENVTKLKNYMYQAIDETNFDSLTKSKFKDIIETIQIGNFADYIEKSGLEDNALAQYIGGVCGTDGLIDNTYATTVKGNRYVLVCPGFLITLSKSASEKEQFDSVLHAIANAMGHFIDNSNFGEKIFMPYLKCIADNYIDRFNKSEEDKIICERDAVKKTPGACADKVILSHARDLIADQWGIKVAGIHARSENYSVSDSETMLTLSWANICGSIDEGFHPTGDFRIGTLMRLNPSIVNILSCGNRAENLKPACTFDGAVPQF